MLRRLIVVVFGLAVSCSPSWALSDSSVPTKVPTIWASSAPGGNVTCPIPISSQQSITKGRASWTDGFPPTTFQPVNSGGVPPFGADFNGVLCQLSQWTQWQNAGGPLYYDASFSSSVGGYPKGATLASGSVPGCFWVSSVDNNQNNPDIGGANWVNTCSIIFSSVGANTWIGNPTGSTGPATANTLPSCPDTAGKHLNYVSGSGFVCGTTTPTAIPVTSISGGRSISTLDCGTAIAETGAQQTLTLPSASGFSNGCFVWAINANNGRAQVLSGAWPVPQVGCGAACLWPGQAIQVMALNNAWIAITSPGRYQTTSAVIYMAPSPSCNDNNDGLTSLSAICTSTAAVALLQKNFDTRFNNPTIQLEDGTYNQQFTVTGIGPYSADGININGDAGTPTNVLVNAPANEAAGFTRDLGLIFWSNLEIGCANSGASGLQSSQNAVQDATNVTFGSCDGHNVINPTDGGHIDLDGGDSITGNSASFFIAQGTGAQVEAESQQINCSGSLTISFFANASFLSQINAPGLTFSGCTGVSGTRYVGTNNAVITTNGGGANYFPGTIAGSTSNGGIYQ